MPLDTSRPEITQALTRGVCRFLTESAITPLREFKLASKRRADVAGLDEKGRFTIVEVKSSPADFLADNKWPDYLEFCEQYYFAVAEDFPRDILPADQGLIIADGYGAEIVDEAEARKVNATRKKSLTLNFARTAANRLHQLADPETR